MGGRGREEKEKQNKFDLILKTVPYAFGGSRPHQDVFLKKMAPGGSL